MLLKKLCLISALLIPSTCYGVVPCDRQMRRSRQQYDQVVVIKDANVKRSYWRIVTTKNGCRTLVVVKRAKKDERVYPVPLHWNPPKQPIRPQQPAKPQSKPIVIQNPYLE